MAGNMPMTRSRKRSLEESNVEVSPENEDSIPECAVCLQECSHPCRLPCGHIFCFLCVKGVSLNQSNCPMCRASIPRGYFDNPDILSVPKKTEAPSAEGFKWYYEGRHGGWWEYDGRTSADLDEAFIAKERSIQVLIAGTLYVIDLTNMVQTKADGSSSRRIKRSLRAIPSKGIAGIRKHRRLPERPPLLPLPAVEPYISDLEDDDDDYYDPDLDDHDVSDLNDDEISDFNDDDDDFGPDTPVVLSSESEYEVDDVPFIHGEPFIHREPEPEIISSDSEGSETDLSEPEYLSDYEPGDPLEYDYDPDDFDDCDYY